MSGTRPVPTNLDSWPGVIDLVVTYKHLLHVLWSSPTGLMSIIGVGGAGIIEHLTGATRLDEPVILEALRELHRRGLVVLDEETREVAVRRWCRFHTFGGKWAVQAQVAYSKIESSTIKGILAKHEGVNDLFPEKSKLRSPSSNGNGIYNIKAAEAGEPDESLPTAQSKPAASSPRKRMTIHPSGIECWSNSDAIAADQLVASNTAEDLAAAIAATKAAGKSSVPGTVAGCVLAIKKAKAAADAEAAHRAHLAAQDTLYSPPPLTSEAFNKLPAAAQRMVAGRIPITPTTQNEGATP